MSSTILNEASFDFHVASECDDYWQSSDDASSTIIARRGCETVYAGSDVIVCESESELEARFDFFTMLESLADDEIVDQYRVRLAWADPYGMWKDAIQSATVRRLVPPQGFKFEAHCDGFQPDIDDCATMRDIDETMDAAAIACLNAWDNRSTR
jgi:hypothetical protein